jgi:hypothetical protein
LHCKIQEKSLQMTSTNSTSGSTGIQVIGCGLGRTGTKSLQAALDLLGYRTYHFPLPHHAKVWADFADGTASADEVLDMVVKDGFTATCDQPPADLYMEQLEKYPDAKVVLTVRDNGAAWATSWKVLMSFIEVQERPFSLTYPSFLQWIPFMQAWRRMRDVMGVHIGLEREELIRGWKSKPDPDAWLAAQYEAHNKKVISSVPKNKLLVFNVKEGWEPLCKHLGVPVPNVPFPRVNESADLETGKKVMIGLTYAWIPVMASVSLALVRVCLRFRR